MSRAGQQRNGAPGTGVQRSDNTRQFVIKIDNATAEQVIDLARREGTSTAEQIRLLIKWGLEAIRDRHDMNSTTRDYAQGAVDWLRAKAQGDTQ